MTRVNLIALLALSSCTCGTEPEGAAVDILREKMSDHCFASMPCYAAVHPHGGSTKFTVWQCSEHPVLQLPGADLFVEPRPWNEGGPNDITIASYTLYEDGSGEFSGFSSGSAPPMRKADPKIALIIESSTMCKHIPLDDLPQAETWDSLFGEDWEQVYEVDCRPATCTTWLRGDEITFALPPFDTWE